MRNIIVLFFLTIILAGCGPFLLVDQPPVPAPLGSLYIVRSAIYTPDSSFIDGLKKVGFRIVKKPQQADYTLFVGSVLDKISIMFFSQKDNICLIDRTYTPVAGDPAPVIAHDMRRAISGETSVRPRFNGDQFKCKI